MSAMVEDLYIFDPHNNLVLEHTFTSRPLPASTLLKLYLAHPTPRPSLQYLPSINPPTILFSIIQDGLLFLAPSSAEVQPLLVFEFLHRVADALEEFLGSPLLASRIESHYDVIAQVLAEMCDAGMLAQTEANALRDVVETPSMMDKLFAGIGLPSASAGLASAPNGLALQGYGPNAAGQLNASQIPWRRSNVRHTSNELYVDMVESLQVTFAPSGRPLAAFANGSVAFTCKVSGVPDLMLSLAAPTGGTTDKGERTRRTMERPVFHPCVRLSRWKTEGILSFIPPDGRFVLAGYQTDLLGNESDPLTAKASDLNLPVSIQVSKSLGSAGNEFEIKLTLNNAALNRPGSTILSQSLTSSLSSTSRVAPRPQADPKTPKLEDLTVHVSLPPSVRNVTELRASKGEATWTPTDASIEWAVSSRVLSTFQGTVMNLRCGVVGPESAAADDDDGNNDDQSNTVMTLTNSGDYDPDDNITAASKHPKRPSIRPSPSSDDEARRIASVARNSAFMPLCVRLGFNVRGWLASGLRVESLAIDHRRSKGVGDGVKPYKGVKYLTASEGGIEVRC